MSDKKLSPEQTSIRAEFVAHYHLEAAQISFDGDSAQPIFDYEALCALSLVLTDFQDITVGEPEIDEAGYVLAKCSVVLKDGRTRSIYDSAFIGETLPDGKKIETRRLAEQVARARAMRTGIRTAGVNLLRAHRQFVIDGMIGELETVNPLVNLRKEIHALAIELGLIKGKDKAAYQFFIAEQFDGRDSSSDLDETELRRLAITLRAMRRVNRAAAAA